MDTMAFLAFFLLTVIVLKTIYFLSSKARFYVRFSTYCLILFLSSVMVILLSLFSPRNVNNLRYYFPLSDFISWLLGVRFEVRGRHHVNNNSVCILVSNHRAELEPLGMTKTGFRNFTFLSRKENLTVYGPFGWATWLCGAFFIDRYNKDSAKKTMEKCARTLKAKKIRLWIFPEGKISCQKDTFMPFKKGAFNLAVEAQVPIVPVVFSSFDHFYSYKEERFDTGKVIITCLPPVSTVGLTWNDVHDLTERIRNDMLDVYKRTTREVLSEQ